MTVARWEDSRKRLQSSSTAALHTLDIQVLHAMQAFLAVAACGAIAVPINLRWSIQEAAAALNGVAAKLVFVDADLAQNYSPILAERQCIVLAAGERISAAASDVSLEAISRQASSPFFYMP